MAEITINGLPIDTEDIDLLVLYCPLATLDAAIKADTEILETMPETDPLRPYFQHRLETHQIALDKIRLITAWRPYEPYPTSSPPTPFLRKSKGKPENQ